MECLLGNPNIRALVRSIHSLSKIGDELYISASKTGLTFRTMNAAQSAYATLTFNLSFFLSYKSEFDTDLEEGKCKIAMKSLLTVFKSPHSADRSCDTCQIRLNFDCTELVFHIERTLGYTKTFFLYVSDTEAVQLEYNTTEMCNELRIYSKPLHKSIRHFRKSDEEITFLLSFDKTHMRNYSNNVRGDVFKVLRTDLRMAPAEFEVYKISEEVTITFALRELRAICMFGDLGNFPIVMRFSCPGRPMVFSFRQNPNFEIDYVLSTLPFVEPLERPLNRHVPLRYPISESSPAVDSQSYRTSSKRAFAESSPAVNDESYHTSSKRALVELDPCDPNEVAENISPSILQSDGTRKKNRLFSGPCSTNRISNKASISVNQTSFADTRSMSHRSETDHNSVVNKNANGRIKQRTDKNDAYSQTNVTVIAPFAEQRSDLGTNTNKSQTEHTAGTSIRNEYFMDSARLKRNLMVASANDTDVNPKRKRLTFNLFGKNPENKNKEMEQNKSNVENEDVTTDVSKSHSVCSPKTEKESDLSDMSEMLSTPSDILACTNGEFVVDVCSGEFNETLSFSAEYKEFLKNKGKTVEDCQRMVEQGDKLIRKLGLYSSDEAYDTEMDCSVSMTNEVPSDIPFNHSFSCGSMSLTDQVLYENKSLNITIPRDAKTSEKLDRLTRYRSPVRYNEDAETSSSSSSSGSKEMGTDIQYRSVVQYKEFAETNSRSNSSGMKKMGTDMQYRSVVQYNEDTETSISSSSSGSKKNDKRMEYRTPFRYNEDAETETSSSNNSSENRDNIENVNIFLYIDPEFHDAVEKLSLENLKLSMLIGNIDVYDKSVITFEKISNHLSKVKDNFRSSSEYEHIKKLFSMPHCKGEIVSEIICSDSDPSDDSSSENDMADLF